jgi:2-isopropylmalate synthase
MLKNPQSKYKAFPPIHDMAQTRTWPNKTIDKAPIWCSVDLRDGNQSLIEPMDIDRKLKMFKLLVKMGFKEIEIGFPSASQIEFDFVRILIEQRLIPDDVSIQVLTQARSHLIERSFEALKGAKNAIMHMYNSTAPIMREVVLKQSREGVIKMATDHAQLIYQLAQAQNDTNWRFEYSPEMFSSTELDFAKDISEAVVEAFQSTPEKPLILNLPSTVECASPNIFADQIEWMHTRLKYRDSIILSVHPHNDRGTGTAAAELSLLAGADRLEGCLFGNGERTGNLDLVNVALNMYTQGIHPNLEIDQIDDIRNIVEHCNQLPVHPRHPYVGDLVYTSFSGSHQDAIKKAFESRKEGDIWWMPYLPIDPKDLGRSYEAVIRVNSQSGKGGISYLLQQEYGLELPRRLQIEFSQVVQDVMDQDNKEFSAQAIWQIFDDNYLQATTPYRYQEHHLQENSSLAQAVQAQIHLLIANDERIIINGLGNGPIDAVTQGLNAWLKNQQMKLEVLDYHEHALSKGQDARAICYLEMRIEQMVDDKLITRQLFGVGTHQNIITASFKAILSGVNRYLKSA